MHITINIQNDTPHIETHAEDAHPDDVTFVFDSLTEFNRRFAEPGNCQPLHVFLRDAQNAIVGGLLGEIYWGWLHISIVWIHDDLRGKGYGSLILHQAEENALKHGCHHAHLDTMDWQALGFYEKHGYSIFGVLEDLPIGHSRYFMQKALRKDGHHAN